MKVIRIIIYLIAWSLIGCSEAPYLDYEVNFNSESEVTEFVDSLHGINAKFGIYTERVKNIDRLTNHNSIYNRYYKSNLVFDSQVATIFNLNGPKTLQIWIYKSGFDTKLELDNYIKKIKSINDQ